jgi:hypothetical protein
MTFQRDVIVMAVDGLPLRSEGRQLCAHNLEHGGHHDLSVLTRKFLCPGDGGNVVLKQRFALLQPGEVPVRQRPRLQGFAGLGNEMAADAVKLGQ